MGISTSFQTAKVVPVLGVLTEFPRLDIFELSRIAESIKAHRRSIAERLAAETGLFPAELFNVLSTIELNEPTVQEIVDYCLTPTGGVSVLTQSLEKRGVSKEQIREIITNLGVKVIVETAQDVVIYKPVVPAPDKVSSPNGGAGVATTGVNTQSPSPADQTATTPTGSPALTTSAVPLGMTPSPHGHTALGVPIPAAYGDPLPTPEANPPTVK